CRERFPALSESAMRPMLPGWSTARSCAERSCEPDRRIASDDIGSDRTESDRDGRAHVEIACQREYRKPRPDADQRQGEPAPAHDPHRVKDMDRNKCQHDQRSDGKARKRGAQMQQEQIECRGIPQRRESAEMI